MDPSRSRPLCVDMDGTLLESDTMEDLIVAFLRANFWKAPLLLLWLLRGRAFFKRKLGQVAPLEVNSLVIHDVFVKWLEEQFRSGRTIVLVSAADESVVRKVAARFPFFSGAIGSDGKTNLRGDAKARRLTELYGEKGFDYAGNSHVDYPVWRDSAESIVVNASPVVERAAREIGNVTQIFPPRPDAPGLLGRLLRRLR